MSYRININRKSLKSARFISHLQKTIQLYFINSGMTQQDVAEKLGVNRSVINKRLKGNANLTARSIAEFAYAFDKEPVIEFRERHELHNGGPLSVSAALGKGWDQTSHGTLSPNGNNAMSVRSVPN